MRIQLRQLLRFGQKRFRDIGKSLKRIDLAAIMSLVIAVPVLAEHIQGASDSPAFLGAIGEYLLAVLAVLVFLQILGSICIWISKIGKPNPISLDVQQMERNLAVPTFGKGRVAFLVTNNDVDYSFTGCYATLEGCFSTTLEDITKGDECNVVFGIPRIWIGKKLLWSNPSTSTGTLDIASGATEVLYPIEVCTRHFCFVFSGNTDQLECDSPKRGLPAGWYIITVKVQGELDGESAALSKKFVGQLHTMPTVGENPTQLEITSILHLCEYDEFIQRQKPEWRTSEKGKEEALSQEKFSQSLTVAVQKWVKEQERTGATIDEQDETTDQKDNP